MPKYEDLVDLRQKVIPPMQNFDRLMQSYTEDHYMFKEMISKMDKTILLKANKTQLVEHEIHTRAHFATKQ
jgi:hypothetical protein